MKTMKEIMGNNWVNCLFFYSAFILPMALASVELFECIKYQIHTEVLLILSTLQIDSERYSTV